MLDSKAKLIKRAEKFLKLRKKATKGKWYRFGEKCNKYYPEKEWHQWILLQPNLPGDYVLSIDNVRKDDKENAEFIAYAANHGAELIESLLKALGSPTETKYHEESK